MLPKIIVANWKLYPTLSDSLVLSASLKKELANLKGVHVVLAPPLGWLAPVVEHWGHKYPHVDFAAQNVWPEDQGAYTGEMSAYMLKNIVKYAIVGHSERRKYADEQDDLIREKLQACLRWRLTPIICVGETKKIVDTSGKIDSFQWQKLSSQLMEALHGLQAADLQKIIVAYEPVWAVGSHNPARPGYVEEMIGRLRSRVAEKYSKSEADELRFIYGGSVSSDNASDYLRSSEIDGLLAGEVSVHAREFLKICQIAAARS